MLSDVDNVSGGSSKSRRKNRSKSREMHKHYDNSKSAEITIKGSSEKKLKKISENMQQKRLLTVSDAHMSLFPQVKERQVPPP